MRDPQSAAPWASWEQHCAGGEGGCWAWPAAHLGVDVCVLLQAHRMAEGFAADVTSEGPGPAVGSTDVHLEPVWCGEDLGAGTAHEARGPCPHLRQHPTPATMGGLQKEPWIPDSAGLCCVSWDGPFPLVAGFPVCRTGAREPGSPS